MIEHPDNSADILYGDHSRQAIADDWHPGKIDVAELGLDDDGYCLYSGYVGCSEWLVKAETLPSDWIRRSHYSPQNESGAEGLLKRLRLGDHQDFTTRTTSCWLRPTDDQQVIIETGHDQYQISAHKPAAIELLSSAQGEWRLYAQERPKRHPLLIYLGETELLGLIKI